MIAFWDHNARGQGEKRLVNEAVNNTQSEQCVNEGKAAAAKGLLHRRRNYFRDLIAKSIEIESNHVRCVAHNI